MIGLGADETLNEFRRRCSHKADREKVFALPTNVEPKSWKEMGNGTFYWLRRSWIENYGSNCKIWQRWLLRVMLAMQGIAQDEAPDWRSGFDVYDEIAKSLAEGKGTPKKIKKLKTYKKFEVLKDFLALELEWHTRDHLSRD